jgi:hypothetical protein
MTDLGLVSNNANGSAFHSGEANNNVLGKVGHNLEEVLFVHQLLDHLSSRL